MKFRKKPVVIEAEQYHPFGSVAGVSEIRTIRFLDEGEPEVKIIEAWVKTLEGNMAVNDGDWIVTGVAGERYPVKDEIFRATYEPVES